MSMVPPEVDAFAHACNTAGKCMLDIVSSASSTPTASGAADIVRSVSDALSVISGVPGASSDFYGSAVNLGSVVVPNDEVAGSVVELAQQAQLDAYSLLPWALEATTNCAIPDGGMDLLNQAGEVLKWLADSIAHAVATAGT